MEGAEVRVDGDQARGGPLLTQRYPPPKAEREDKNEVP